MKVTRLKLLVLIALLSGSCGERLGPKASESLHDAIINPVNEGEPGPMLCIDSVAVHINDKAWKRSERVWSTTEHEQIVEIVRAVRMPTGREAEGSDEFVVSRDDVRIFFVCREQDLFASVRIILPSRKGVHWHIRDGVAGSVWTDRGALEQLVRRLGIAQAAGIE